MILNGSAEFLGIRTGRDVIVQKPQEFLIHRIEGGGIVLWMKFRVKDAVGENLRVVSRTEALSEFFENKMLQIVALNLGSNKNNSSIGVETQTMLDTNEAPVSITVFEPVVSSYFGKLFDGSEVHGDLSVRHVPTDIANRLNPCMSKGLVEMIHTVLYESLLVRTRTCNRKSGAGSPENTPAGSLLELVS